MAKETKEQRFKRVAQKRVQNLLKGISSLSQMANTKVYQWNKNQLNTIWTAIEKELADCKKSFEDPNSLVFKL